MGGKRKGNPRTSAFPGRYGSTHHHHLAHLRTAGLVFSQRSGKHIEYEPATDRVRYDRHAGARFSLSVTAA